METQKKEAVQKTSQEEPQCENCGMPKSEWKGNLGKGYQVEGETYCCRGCAEDGECDCQEREEQ